MPSPRVQISQPCAESWAAMTPVGPGRHCAACQKTVVDFTQKTDAEIMAYLRQAGAGQACGRFRAGQLARPLLPAEAPGQRQWRTWLAALLAAWAVRASPRTEAYAHPPATQLAPVPSPHPKQEPPPAPADSMLLLRGTVLDSATHDKLPGVTVVLRGTSYGASTDQDGRFSLRVPAVAWQKAGYALSVSTVGYVAQTIPLSPTAPAPVEVVLAADNRVLGEYIVIGGYKAHLPWPWHPRRLYYWSKYWLTRPFRR